MTETEVAVIGGGLAGLVAALAAAEAGAEVVLVRRGLGTTAMGSGALDFPAELPALWISEPEVRTGGAAPGGAGPTAGPSPRPGSESVAEAAEALVRWLGAEGLRLEGRPGAGLALMDIFGHVRRADLAPASLAAGRVDRWPGPGEGGGGGCLLFVEVEPYGAFRAEWCRRAAVAAGLVRDEQTAVAVVPVPGLEEEGDVPAVRVARALEDPDTGRVFAAAVAGRARRAGATAVALPPVLGLDRSPQVLSTLELALTEAYATHGGRPPVAFELLSPPPSVPAQRLLRALERRARAVGVRVEPGRVAGPAKGPDPAGRARWERGLPVGAVVVETHGRTWTLAAQRFVLATGKFVSGGLEAGERGLRETVFGLDVFVPPPPGWPPGRVPAGSRPARDLVWDRFAARHPVFEAGLAVDGRLRPLDAEGRVAAPDVLAAGSVIGGASHFADGSGSGVAAVTGLLAGRLAAAEGRRGA
ncbi:MAG: FAD-binding protein [Firmicutes bacterium]|nr:FAD-binding protein [Bacillota bacterium]